MQITRRQHWQKNTRLSEQRNIPHRQTSGDGSDEIVAGFRGKPSGVYIYRFDGARWNRGILHEGSVSAASCAAPDLDGDAKPEIACIGQATNILVLWHSAP